MTGGEARDDQGRVVWYDSTGTAAAAAPVLAGAHIQIQQQAAVLVHT